MPSKVLRISPALEWNERRDRLISFWMCGHNSAYWMKGLLIPHNHVCINLIAELKIFLVTGGWKSMWSLEKKQREDHNSKWKRIRTKQKSWYQKVENKGSVRCPGITWGDEERTLGFFSLIRVWLMSFLLLLWEEVEVEENKIYLLREKSILKNSFQFT